MQEADEMVARGVSVMACIVNPEATGVLLGDHVRHKLWLPVGGQVEENEDPVQALARAVMEETGLVLGRDVQFIERLAPVGFSDHDIIPYQAPWRCERFRGTATQAAYGQLYYLQAATVEVRRHPVKHERLEWVPLEELRSLVRLERPADAPVEYELRGGVLQGRQVFYASEAVGAARLAPEARVLRLVG